MAKKLPLLDSGWLTMETPETAMHVGGLLLFKLPDDAPEDFLQNLLRDQLDLDRVGAPFNLKLRTRLPLQLDAAWVEDDRFDLEYHVRITALPRPGRVRELLALVSRLHQQRLDLRRPPWECYLIEGLDGGRFGVYVKIHHSLVDGVAAMRLLQSRLSTGPDQKSPPIWSAQWNEGRARSNTPATRPSPALSRAIRSYGSGARQWLGGLRRRADDGSGLPQKAPDTIFNTRVTPARRFAAQSWDIARVRAVAKAHGATLNDVFLAMCSGCLRQYLIEREALPDEPLVSYVPVSVRASDQRDDGGNAISAVQVTLATDIAEPSARLAAIHGSMNHAKKKLARMGRAELDAYTTFSNLPLLIGQMTGLSGRMPAQFNLVISNVPGPTKPLYFGGAELLATYPVSLIWHGYALNITVQSYNGHLDVGFIACRDTVPHVQRMLGYLEDALVELEAAAPLLPRPSRKSVR
ncbi:MAG: wax ester/triacylglycerol synthase family O-acyltransferase [Pseudomonadota bacterium]|nr:wax ester/triacylglycerol synthase family O-acyltransferase [Pseudomonadota bacterium]